MTLVEMVIATMVLSMILLGLVTALRTFANSHALLEASLKRTANFREVSTFLRHSMRSAVFPAPDAFRLTPTEIVWRAPVDRVGSAGGVLWLRLRQESDHLMLDFALPESDSDEDAESEPRWGEEIPAELLLEGIDHVSFSAKWTDDGGWVDAPETQPQFTGLPRLLKLDFTLEMDDWPATIIALDEFREASL